MKYKISSLIEVLVSQENRRSAGRIFIMFDTNFVVHLSSGYSFFDPEYTTSTLYTSIVRHFGFDCHEALIVAECCTKAVM
jgi:hypothetical protein